MKHDEIKSSQINEFCLKQRQGLKASAAPLYSRVPLPLPLPGLRARPIMPSSLTYSNFMRYELLARSCFDYFVAMTVRKLMNLRTNKAKLEKNS